MMLFLLDVIGSDLSVVTKPFNASEMPDTVKDRLNMD